MAPAPPLVLRAKVAVIGGPTVGKSALLHMFHSNYQRYPKHYHMTVGADVLVKQIRIPETDCTVELFLHDIGGSALFEDMTDKFLENVSAYCFVYDVSSPESFAHVDDLLKKALANRPTSSQEGLPLDGSVLIGNKRDLEERYDVAAAEGHKKAQQHGLEFFEASALKGPDGHIDEPFNCLAAKYYQAYLATKEHYELGV